MLKVFKISCTGLHIFDDRLSTSYILYECMYVLTYLLKASRNKKDLNDVTAAPFSVFFCCWQLRKRHGTAVTSLRSFLFRDDLKTYILTL